MRESVSGRPQGDGVNPEHYADDLAAGERGERDYIEYRARTGNPIQPWVREERAYPPDYGKPPPRQRLIPAYMRAPDLYCPITERWKEVKWKRSVGYHFNAREFVSRIQEKKLPDYVWLARRHMPVDLIMVVESAEPPQGDLARWRERGEEPITYPTGVFVGDITELDRVAEYHHKSAWFPLSAFRKVLDIEEYRRVLDA